MPMKARRWNARPAISRQPGTAVGTHGRWVERLTLYAFDLSPGSDTPRRPDVTVVPADAVLLQRMKEQHPAELTDRKYAILQDRLQTPHETCFVLEGEDAELLGYCHTATATTLNARINYRVRLRGPVIYLYDDHVFGRYRRRGLHQHSIIERRRIAYAEGYRAAVTIISDGNTASICSYRAVDAEPARALIHVRAFHRTLSLPYWLPGLHPPQADCRRA